MAEPDAAPAAELDEFTAALAAQGFPTAGGYPVNLRLRGEALSIAGKVEDPLGYVTPEFIAETGERLAADAHDAAEREREARAKTPKPSWPLSDLIAYAQDHSLPVGEKPTKAAILDAVEKATPADPTTSATPNEG